MGKQKSGERQAVNEIRVILAVGRQIINTLCFWSGEVESCILLLECKSKTAWIDYGGELELQYKRSWPVTHWSFRVLVL